MLGQCMQGREVSIHQRHCLQVWWSCAEGGLAYLERSTTGPGIGTVRDIHFGWVEEVSKGRNSPTVVLLFTS